MIGFFSSLLQYCIFSTLASVTGHSLLWIELDSSGHRSHWGSRVQRLNCWIDSKKIPKFLKNPPAVWTLKFTHVRVSGGSRVLINSSGTSEYLITAAAASLYVYGIQVICRWSWGAGYGHFRNKFHASFVISKNRNDQDLLGQNEQGTKSDTIVNNRVAS